MPKYRGKKKSTAPYDGSKKSTNTAEKDKVAQGSDHLEDSLGCDFCKSDADNIIQCENVCLGYVVIASLFLLTCLKL